MRNDTDLNKKTLPLIVFDGVSKKFEKEVAVQNVSFSVADGEFVCIIGTSGSGKSTVVKIIAGLEEATAGNVVRPENVSLVFQNGALFPWLSVFENVALPLRIKGENESKTKKETDVYLKLTGLADFAGKYPRELSGGQRQRVGIARALVVNPNVLLLDEPFSALDIKTTEELHNDIINIWKQTKKTVVMISHSIEEAVELADRIILMENQTIKEIFSVSLPRPRRIQVPDFAHEVMRIRQEFFRKG